MNITEIRVKLVGNNTERLRAFCSVTFDEEFVVTIPEIRFRGSSPTLTGEGLIELSAPFSGYHDGTNPPMTITLQSTDTSI